MSKVRIVEISLLEKLSSACNEMGLQLNEKQKEHILTYLKNLLLWNKTYNLTAIRDPEQALIQHIYDSLSVVSPIKKYIHSQNIIRPKIIDVGSGGGLPGVILAIAMPEVEVTCIDKVEKKVTFIRQIISLIKNTNLHAKHARVEELEKENANVVISRAFSSLEDFAALAGQHVAAEGKLVGMKGKYPEEEKTKLLEKGEWIIENVETLNVPELQAERCLVWMQRKG